MVIDDTVLREPGRIFISYRRGAGSYPAALLYDRLTAEFGQTQVFKDVDNVRPGEDFVERMTRAVASCDALLVVIGPGWAQAKAERGEGLENPSDFVRLEIEIALNRGIRVIPVLVEDARMPSAEELPQTLRSLARRQAHELSPTRSRRDTDELVATLRETFLGSASGETASVASAPRTTDPASGVPAGPEHGPRGAGWAVPSGLSPVMGRRHTVRRRPPAWWLAAALVVVGLAVATPWVRGPVRGGTERDGSVGPGETLLPRSAEPMADDVMVWRLRQRGVLTMVTVGVDGAKRVNLVSGGEENYAGVMSRDRRTVLYLRRDDTGRKTLRAVAADGSEDRRLFSDGLVDCPVLRRPAWGPAGVLAMVCGSKGKPDVLTLLSLDGQVIRQLTKGRLGEPTFVRGGRSVVYWANASGGSGDGGALFEVAVDGASDPVQLTDGGDGVDADPAASPDGLSVAFRHGQEGSRQIQVLALDPDPDERPAELRSLTSGRRNDQDPSWSPDGSEIAFRRGPDPSSDLYVMPAAGEPAAWVVNHSKQDSAPVWTTR